MSSDPVAEVAEVAAGAAASPATPRRIGVMGGTFDPIHNGHLVAASEVASRVKLDEVVFVPTGRPWQKEGEHAADPSRKVSPAEHRYLMTVIATASNPQFTASRVDIEREGVTFTVDTLRDLRRAYPDDELYFITGADALDTILNWHDWEDLFELANFIGVSRPGYELNATHLTEHLASKPARSLQMIEIPALAISSTDCRDRAGDGRPVWYLVPDGVVQYIAKHGLYRKEPQ
ncbi:nicotinate-nucleotide adenylyltransferase [Gordonia zhaorongruii]|uniref:nicotinate-nucleotide adenylyltransferase n=1 Tax=Gordonia zhaorongruii TaxID=2597659 RepID=UPI00104E52E8|nr:nicotinate-nucleotide adenylyltransferase [Gordonia zhaorongruii]